MNLYTMRNKELHGFTIMEFIVAMILSSIVVGIGYQAIRTMRSLFWDYSFRIESSNDHTIIRSLIQSDIAGCDKLYKTETGWICMNIDFHADYLCLPDYIVRTKMAHADTFRIKTNNVEGYYNNNQISNGVCDRIQLKIEIDKTVNVLSFSKNYSALQLIDIEKELEN